MTAANPREVIGGNRPPEPLDVSLVTSDVGVLQARLERDYADMANRFVELGEFGAAKVPARITTEAEAKMVIDWVGEQCKVLIARAEAAHAREKKSYLEPARVVDRFFLDPIKRLGEVLGLDRKTRTRDSVMGRVQQFYDTAKVAQRQREETARQQAHQARVAADREARRLAAEAKAAEAAGDRTTAVELTRMAEREETNAAIAAVQAEAPPAPVAIRGDYGSTAFAIEKWTWEALDPAGVPILELITMLKSEIGQRMSPELQQQIEMVDQMLGYLTWDAQAVQQAIDRGVRDIPNLRIFQADRLTIRRC